MLVPFLFLKHNLLIHKAMKGLINKEIVQLKGSQQKYALLDLS